MNSVKTELITAYSSLHEHLDDKVNIWLDQHNYYKLIDIKFAIDAYNTEEAFIIYCEDSDSYYDKNNELNLDKINKDLAQGKLTWVGDKLQRL